MVKFGTGKSSKKSINISKGLLYVFFSLYLIYFGVMLTGFVDTIQTQNPGILPVYISYLPFLCYIGALFLGIMFILFVRNATIQKSRETKSRKSKGGSLYRRALFLIIFIFAFVPLLSPIIDNGTNNHYFSIYNSDWNGGSSFKQTIEDQGYEVLSVQSSLSAINRIDKNVLLVLFGPNQFYDPIFEIPFFINFFANGSHTNSLLLLHDHGSTYQLLWQIFIANLLNFDPANIFPVTIFPDGILRDNASCLENALGEGDSSFPIITDLDSSHPTTSGVSQVILSEATAAAGGQLLLESLFGWDVVGQASYASFVDKNGNEKYDYNATTKDFTDSIDLTFLAPVLAQFFDQNETELLEQFLHFPLGSDAFIPAVFLAKELTDSRVFVSSDASMFSNDLIDRPEYDNKQFAINIIKWLTYSGIDNPEDWVVVFDEAHIRPEYSRDLSSAGIYGFILQYVIHLSTNPITAWIYPLWAFYVLRKYLPRKDKEEEEKKKIEKEEEKEEKEKFRTSSFFAQKINWYKEKNRYDKALVLLFRRMERKLNAQLSGMKMTTKNVIDLVIAKESGGKVNRQKIRRLTKLMDKMLTIKAGKSKVKSPQEFEDLFLEMSWAMKNI